MEKENWVILAVAAVAIVAIVALALPRTGGIGYTAKEEKIGLRMLLDNGSITPDSTVSVAEHPTINLLLYATKKFEYVDYTVINMNTKCIDYYGTLDTDTLNWRTTDTVFECGYGRYLVLAITSHRSGTELSASALITLEP